ncbi:hypothetical protein [Photobacterium damselae]|uniref:hypothetical protein n=1 Tax=Photobacterium damselae TaxID=38293 RepID=UPI0030F40160
MKIIIVFLFLIISPMALASTSICFSLPDFSNKWWVQGALGVGVNNEESLSNSYIGAGISVAPQLEAGFNIHYRYGYWDDQKRHRFDPEAWLRMKTALEGETQFYGELGWQWHNPTPYAGVGILYTTSPLVDVDVGYRYYRDGNLPSGRDDVISVYVGVRVTLDSSIIKGKNK